MFHSENKKAANPQIWKKNMKQQKKQKQNNQQVK